MENKKKLFPEFGQRFSFPENFRIEYGGLEGCIYNEVAVRMAENYDTFVTTQIAMEARASGISDITILNKRAIINALNKQIPEQVIMNQDVCLCPACHYDIDGAVGLPGCSRPKLLPDLRTETEVEDERWQKKSG